MKKKSDLVLLCALMLSSFAAQAAASNALTVKGTIRPTACIPSLGNAGVVDYHEIDPAKILAHQATVLEPQLIVFAVTCNGPANFALRIADNRPGSAVPGLSGLLIPPVPDIQAYGLGSVKGSNIGIYTVKVEPDSVTGVTGDGTPATRVNVLGSLGNNDSWTIFSSTYFNADAVSNWKGFARSAAVPEPFASITGNLSVTAVLDKGANLPLRETINLDGSATMELMYL